MTDFPERPDIIAGLDLHALHDELVGPLIPKGRGWHHAVCIGPTHDDTRPSMGVNEDHGGFNCVSCALSGDLFDLYQRVKRVDFPTAKHELASLAGVDLGADPEQHRTIDSAVVDANHERLKATADRMEFLTTERGLTPEIIDEFKLGHDGQRYYIPIHEPTTSAYVNIRRYDPQARAQDKMISWRTGFGAARLWPMEAVLEDHPVVYLMEGEMDALLARSLGLNALTCTGGAGTWRDPWSVMFVGLHVVICYDADNAGRAGAVAVARKLHGRAESVKIVEIPLPEIRGADFTDYIVTHGHTREDFLTLVRETPEFVMYDAPEDVVSPSRPGVRTDGEYYRTDTGNGARVIDMYSDRLRWVDPFKSFLVFEAGRWALDIWERAMRFAKESLREIFREAAEVSDPGEHAKWARISQSNVRLKAMLANSHEGLAVAPADLDADPYLFNFANGTLNLRTSELRPHDPDDLITKISPVAFDPDATAPTFERFLDETTCGRGELGEFLQEIVGLAMIGAVEHHILPLAVGSGANGKTTFADVVSYVFGEYAVTAPPKLLVSSRNERHPTEIARLRGARFVDVGEIDQGDKLAEAKVKLLTGGDVLSGRGMGENFYDFRPSHTFFMHVNHKPVITGTDHGIWRRIALIPFDATVETPDPALPARLRAEASGILNWLVEGCRRVQEGGLILPDIVKVATDEYRTESDDVSAFVDDRCEEGAYHKVPKGKLYDGYKTWCEEVACEPKSKTAFGKAIKKRFRESSDGSIRRWVGLRLRDEDIGPEWGDV